jgi:hypothetical protein
MCTWPTDLSAMYTFDRSNDEIRDPRAYYGPGAMEPEGFTAELVLRDLRVIDGPDAALRILARYAALRAWHLGAESDTSPEFLDHARAAAVAHLDAAPDEWPERETLRALLEPIPAHRSIALLTEAAEAAEAARHIDGALAARTAAWTAAVRALQLATGAELATGIAAFIRRCGGRADAVSWESIASHLSGIAPGWTPPSPS